MTSWTRELDEAIHLATRRGHWHILLFYLLCFVAAVPTSFLVFSQIFTSASQAHWCAPPPELSALGLSRLELRALSVPRTADNASYENCLMYDMDILALSQRFPHLIEHRSEVLVEAGELRSVRVQQFSLAQDERREDQLRDLKESLESGVWHVVPCKYGWNYDTSQYERTLVSDLDLVCDKGWWPRTSTSLFWVGSLFGNIFFGWMSDRYGRRLTLLWMIFLEVPLAIASSFAKDYVTYTVLRVLGGLFFPALYQVPFVLSLELMPPERRTYTGMVIGMFFASGMCILALVAFALRDWFTLSLTTSLPFVLLFSYYWLIPESPRWLVSRGRISEAEKVLRLMARNNNINLPRGFLIKLHKNVLDFGTNESEFCESPLNGHASGHLNDEDDFFIDRRLANMQTFKPELPNISETEMMPPRTPEIERTLAFEVADFVKKKSRFRNSSKEPSENVVTNEAEPTGVLYPKDNKSEIKQDKEDIIASHEENPEYLQKYTQTEPYTKSPPNTLRRKSLKVVNRLFQKDEYHTEQEIRENKKMDDENSEGDCKASPLDLFKYPNVRKKFFLLTFEWIALGVVYNSFSYNSPNLGVDDYLAFFIGGAVELPSYFVAWKCMDTYGRRWVLSVSMCFGGLACLSCVFVPEDLPWVTVALAMMGRLCASGSFAVFYVMVGELLPTVVRSQAMGASSFIAGLALLACPYIAHLADYSRALPLSIMGILSLAGGIVAVFLSETLNQPLPQTLSDGELAGKDFSLLSCVEREQSKV